MNAWGIPGVALVGEKLVPKGVKCGSRSGKAGLVVEIVVVRGGGWMSFLRAI